MTSEDGDVPPLEDCSVELEKLGLAENSNKKESKRELLEYKEDSEISCFKKGFLLSGSSAKDSTNRSHSSPKRPSDTKVAAVSSECLPEVKANPDAKKDSLVFDEVQSALQQNASFLNAQQSLWLNDDLMKKVEGNEFLLQMMAHPGINDVLAEFQRNPHAAMRKYEKNTEISRFFAEFVSILGTHFEQIGNVEKNELSPSALKSDSTSASKAAKESSQSQKALISEVKTVKTVRRKQESDEDDVESKVRNALSVPEVCEALSDSRVQKLIETLRSSPEQGNRIWHEADFETRRKLQVLIQNGVLGVQR